MIVKMPTSNNLDALKWAKANCPSFEKLSILTPDGEEILCSLLVTVLCVITSDQNKTLCFLH